MQVNIPANQIVKMIYDEWTLHLEYVVGLRESDSVNPYRQQK